MQRKWYAFPVMLLFILLASGWLSPSGGIEPPPPETELAFSQQQYSLADKEVRFTLVNNTPSSILVVMAPLLEKKEGENWAALQMNIGFCGTPDPVPPEGRNGVLSFSRFDDPLEPGIYRVTLNEFGEMITTILQDGTVQHVYSTENSRTFSGEFELVA